MIALDTLNTFSGQISNAIEKNDWLELSDVLTTRQAYLEDLLLSDISVDDRQFVLDVLKSVQAMDRIFIAEVQFKKAHLLKEFQKVRSEERR